jgi:hypothetical protein
MEWKVVYRDGRILTQGIDLQSTEQIDRSKLKEFRLYDNEKLIFNCMFSEKGNKKLIFRKRSFIDMLGNPKGQVYLVGWHENIKGTSIKSICYVYEDGHIEFDDDRNNLELVPCEKWD